MKQAGGPHQWLPPRVMDQESCAGVGGLETTPFFHLCSSSARVGHLVAACWEAAASLAKPLDVQDKMKGVLGLEQQQGGQLPCTRPARI